ncbi:Cytochrome P450 2J3, partial [Lemmus lemmus]
MAQPHMGVQQLVKKYGNVISLDFGIMSSVIVSSLPLVKEAFTQLEENFMSR